MRVPVGARSARALSVLTHAAQAGPRYAERAPDGPASDDPEPDGPAPDAGVAGGGVSIFLPRNLAKYVSLIAARQGL